MERNHSGYYYKSDAILKDLALKKWDQHPYNHVYSWDKKLWPYDAQTITYNPTPTITKKSN